MEILERLETGVFLRDFSGRLCYEIHQLKGDLYRPTRKKIARKFGLLPFGFTIDTPDEAFKTYFKGLSVIGLEWDWSSGFIVLAKNKRAEPIVKEIGQYLESTIKI